MMYAEQKYMEVTSAFIAENSGLLGKVESGLTRYKDILKNARRKETLCLRHLTRETAMEKSPWFYLSNNCCMSILYNLRRISEVCKEHVDNNFLPLPRSFQEEYDMIRTNVGNLFSDTLATMKDGNPEDITRLRHQCDAIKDTISDTYHRVHGHLSEGDPSAVTVLYVYVNMLQETQEMVSALRKYLRAFAKLRDSAYRTRPGLVGNV